MNRPTTRWRLPWNLGPPFSKWWRVAFALYWLALITGTHVPDRWLSFGDEEAVEEFEAGPPLLDKVVHAGAYGGLAALALSVWFRDGVLLPGQAVAVIFIAGVHALLDELAQGLTPDRTPDPWDWLADMGGVLVAVGLFWALFRPVPERNDSTKSDSVVPPC